MSDLFDYVDSVAFPCLCKGSKKMDIGIEKGLLRFMKKNGEFDLAAEAGVRWILPPKAAKSAQKEYRNV